MFPRLGPGESSRQQGPSSFLEPWSPPCPRKRSGGSAVRGEGVDGVGAAALLRRTLFPRGVSLTSAQPQQAQQQGPEQGHLHEGQEHQRDVAEHEPAQERATAETPPSSSRPSPLPTPTEPRLAGRASLRPRPGREGPSERLSHAAQRLAFRGLPAGSVWGPAPFVCFPPAFGLISHSSLSAHLQPSQA